MTRFALFSLATMASICFTSAVLADCALWAVEDTSAGSQNRERIFAWSDLRERDVLVAQAAAIARHRAAERSLDFVDVFLTRPEDGTERSFHMSSTTTVWLRFNPGQTPIMDEVIAADAVDAGAEGEWAYDMFVSSRSNLAEDEIVRLEAAHAAAIATVCATVY